MTGIRTPFGFSATADEVAADVDLTGSRVIVTGGTHGVGFETARVLASRGAAVTVAGRSPDTGRRAAEQLRQQTKSEVTHAELDLADLRSVSRFVASWSEPLDILVNNAGIMGPAELQRSPQGHELQLATNYVGHFALAVGLRPWLARAESARVVSLSSNAHLFGTVDFDDPDFHHRPYQPITAYGQSKAADLLFAVGAAGRWSDDGICVNAVHPGAIDTGLHRDIGGIRTPAERRKNAVQGAATSVLVATSPLLHGITGRYFEDCNEAEVVQGEPVPLGGGVAPWCLDPDNADRLWTLGMSWIAES